MIVQWMEVVVCWLCGDGAVSPEQLCWELDVSACVAMEVLVDAVMVVR